MRELLNRFGTQDIVTTDYTAWNQHEGGGHCPTSVLAPSLAAFFPSICIPVAGIAILGSPLQSLITLTIAIAVLRHLRYSVKSILQVHRDGIPDIGLEG